MSTDTELLLTEAERETLRGLGQGQYVAAAEQIIADRAERAEAELRELRAEVGRLRLNRADLADRNEVLRSRIDRSEEIWATRLADAVAAVTPCTCSAQRVRAEHAERQLSDVAETSRKLFVECRDLRIRAEAAEANLRKLRDDLIGLSEVWAQYPGPALSCATDVRSLLQEGE